MINLFHVCPIPLEAGSVIKAGNFGRVIEQYRPSGLGPLAVRELAFEAVRLKHYAQLPSRLTSIFLLPTLEHAQRYAAQHAFTSLIYQVEPVQDRPIFHGDMSLVSLQFPSEQIPAIPFLMTLADQYWRGVNQVGQDSELLTEASVRIVHVIDPRQTPGVAVS
jgi:hypothetical protein